MSRKYSSCLTLVVLVLTIRTGSPCQPPYSLAASSIVSGSGVASSTSFNSTYSVGIPAGGEVSSNTFWTSAGVGPIASALRCPVWWICGVVFYDANLNGIRDDGECGIPGRQITIMGPGDTIGVTTDATGAFCHTCVQPGSYTVCQALPEPTATCKWVTTALCKTKDVIEPWRVSIGSAYACADGGRSIGYWSNKRVRELISDADLSELRTLNSRNPDGSDFDPTTVSQYQSWLTGPGAANMAYQLSEHASALLLNLAHGMTASNAHSDSGTNSATLLSYANCLLGNPIDSCGGPFAGQNGSVTTIPGALRTEQERVKNLIQQINSRGSFLQPSPCTLHAPARRDQIHAGTKDEDSTGSNRLPLPASYSLSQNYPNPFNPATVIHYALPAGGYVSLHVYNSLGQIVRTLVDGFQDAGYKSVELDARNLASGMYYYRLRTGDFSNVKAMMLVK